jgi:hypothetical protein
MESLYSGTITVVCDGFSALKTAIDIKDVPFISAGIADFDVMQSIRKSMRSGITYNWQHVKGHQDASSVVLTPLEELNVRMDAAARTKRELIPLNATNWFPILPYEDWKIWVDQKQLTKQVEENIRESISEHTMKYYWNKKGKISLSQFHNVGWTAIDKAMNSIPTGRKHWLAKHASGICGVNYIRQKWRERDNPDCPRCGLPETAKHVWHCQHQEVQEIWNKAIIDLLTFLNKIKTDPAISDQICCGLRSWYNGDNLRNTDARPLIIMQCNLGWDAFIEGIVSVEWGQQQQLYYASLNSRKTGLRWTVALLLKLWNIAWDLWSHRNGIEHNHDLATETIRLNEQIEFLVEFHVTSSNAALENMFVPDELTKVRNGTNIYKSAWIYNVEALSSRIERRSANDTELTGMRNILQRFLEGSI